jgi:hypothetical protein
MPKHPSSAKPLTQSSGMRASRSTTAPSRVAQYSRSAVRNRSAFASASGSGAGCGWMRSSRNRPRNSSLQKDGFAQPLSRASSATWRACCSLTWTERLILIALLYRETSVTRQ